MFGKGLYFADMSSKSANYCYATPKKDTGLVLLSEVSILEETNPCFNWLLSSIVGSTWQIE